MENKLYSSPDIGWGHGYIIQEGNLQYLEGRLLTILETVGLPTNQEIALKSLVKSEVWGMFRDTFPITSEQHSRVRKENEGLDQTTPRPYPSK